MKQEILCLFNELIKLWKIAEETVINDRGTVDDYEILEEEEQQFRARLEEILLKIS